MLRQLEEESLQKWQRSWTQATKGTTKEYFPDIEGRIKMTLNHTGNLTTILTGHGNIKAYLQRFQISDDSTCLCGKGEQTTDHIIYDIIRCLLLTYVSTCSGHHYAHLQENKGPVTAFGVLFWFCWMWLVAVVGRCLAGCDYYEDWNLGG